MLIILAPVLSTLPYIEQKLHKHCGINGGKNQPWPLPEGLRFCLRMNRTDGAPGNWAAATGFLEVTSPCGASPLPGQDEDGIQNCISIALCEGVDGSEL